MKPEIVIEMIQANLKMDFSKTAVNNNKKKIEMTDTEIIKKLKTPKKALTRYCDVIKISFFFKKFI